MRMTSLSYIGIGYNKTDMEPLDVWINIFLHEQNAGHDGDQMNDPQDIEFKTQGSSDNISTGSATISGHIRAKWCQLGSNRFTAPTLRVGERVKVYRESDTGRYWWSSLGLDEALRKQETIVWGISASTESGQIGRNSDSMYWFEVSSHSKRIALSTSKKLDEKAAYQMFFDLDAGKFVLRDDIGNEFFLDSVEKIWKMINADGTFTEINKRNITHSAPDNITIKAGKVVKIEAGNLLDMSAGTETKLKTPIFTGTQ